jgi:hypothetical protein
MCQRDWLGNAHSIGKNALIGANVIGSPAVAIENANPREMEATREERRRERLRRPPLPHRGRTAVSRAFR